MESIARQSEVKRMQFGNRHLTDTSKVFEHNAWDDVQWDEEQEKEATVKVLLNSSIMIPPDEQEKLDREASMYWNAFYEQHENRFFKDRNWLFTEFHELAISPENRVTDKSDCDLSAPDSGTSWPGKDAHTRILEVGCGVGNTVFPILQTNSDPSIFVYCCDFAKSAVDLVKDHPGFDPCRCHPFIFDVVDEKTSFPFPDGSLDFVILIFVLSAIHPERMKYVFSRLAKLLKPGGMILFRDYGRYDMAQLRFKQGKCLGENFYLRGDGTRVYFFTQDEMHEMATENGLKELQNHIDRRLQINRGKKLKMYRIWIQCKFQKPK